jgi:hypothetical protein
MLSREQMVQALVQNEIDWVVGDPTYENVLEAVQFFSKGGFSKHEDTAIEKMYNKLTA